MPIRIRLFLIMLGLSLVPLGFVFFLIPQSSQTLFTNSGAPILLMLFMLVILITLAALFIAVHFTLPLTQLREVSQKVQAGEFDQRVNIKKGDEIGELAQAFNTMLGALQNQQATLQSGVTFATKVLNEKVTSLEDTKKASLNLLEDLEEEKVKLDEARIKDEAILASIGDGIVYVDQEGKVMHLNRAACDMLGISAEEIIGKRLIDVVKMEDGKGQQVLPDKRPFTMALSHSKTTTTTTTTTTTGPAYYYFRKDGSKFPAAITTTPVILDGTVIGAIEVFRDITAERSIDQAKSEFISLASHQLRTPLGIIKWSLEALANEKYFVEAPPVIRKYFHEVYKSNERVLSLVRDLLSVSRIEQGRIKNAPEQVDPLHIVADIIEEMQIVAHKKGVALRVIMPKRPVPAMVIDILRFHEVLQNLIGNALEYTLAGGSVEVRVKHAGGTLLLSVHDTGIGISPADQKRIFTKFFRSEKAIRHNPEGSGLGLYVVKAYVEGWGGTIAVESDEGKGSTFIISLPVSAEGQDMEGEKEE